MLVTRRLREIAHKQYCLRCGKEMWIRNDAKKDFCIQCEIRLKEIRDDRRNRK